jgi:hypothetical protein
MGVANFAIFSPDVSRHFSDDNYVYMDDNAPVHRSHLLRNYIAENSIKTTTWPAQSPDINVTENIWLKIKRELENVRDGAAQRDL